MPVNQPAQSSQKNLTRIKWLDSLRGIAILLVALYHFTFRYPHKYPGHAYPDQFLYSFDFGWIGVELFFMISGFIIYLSIQNKKGPVDFMVARLSRLMPPYWVSIMAIVALELLHQKVFDMPYRHSADNVIVNTAMASELFRTPLLEGAFWTLYVEIRFYLFFAILWKFIDLKKKSTFYFSFIFLLIMAVIPEYTQFIPLMGGDINYFIIFWLGIAACKVLKEDMAVWEYGILTFLTAASTYLFYKEGPELFIGIPVFAALFIASEAGFNRYPRLANFISPLAFLGRISYSYYLLHSYIGYVVLGILCTTAISFDAAVVAAMAASLAAAWVSFVLIERRDKKIAAYISGKINSRNKVIPVEGA